MIMRAKQASNTVIFELEGHLDFETTVKFEEACQKVLAQGTEQRLVINMSGLRFVGSSGINQFVQVLKNINSRETKPRLCQVSSEFEKILRALQTVRHPFEILQDEATALVAFDSPEISGSNKRPKRKGTA